MNFDESFRIDVKREYFNKIKNIKISKRILKRETTPLLILITHHIKIKDLAKIIIDYLGLNLRDYFNRITYPLAKMSGYCNTSFFEVFDNCIIVYHIKLNEFMKYKDFYNNRYPRLIKRIERLGVIRSYLHKSFQTGKWTIIPILLIYFK